MRYKKIMALCFAAVLLTGTVGGCGKDSVDYMDDTQGGAEADSVVNLKDFDTEDKWWEQTSAGGRPQVTILTIPTVPDADTMSVVEVSRLDFDEAHKEAVIQAVFGTGDVYLWDEAHQTEEYWQKQVESYEERRKAAKEDGDDDLAESFQEIIKDMKTKRDAAPADYVKAKDYTASDYAGMIDGVLYELSFSGGAECLFKVWMGDDFTYCTESSAKNNSNWNTEVVDDQAPMTEEEARETANAYLEDFGVTGVTCSNTEALYQTDVDMVEASQTEDGKSEFTNVGYAFTYTYEIDGISLDQFGTERNYKEFLDAQDAGKLEDYYSMDYSITVYVGDHYRLVDVRNPITIGKTTKDVAMLPLSEIEGIVRDQLDLHYLDYGLGAGSDDFRYAGMELIYLRVKDEKKDGRYSYVPVWRLSNVDTSVKQSNPETVEYQKCVLVNAIDGSVYHFLDIL